MKTFYIAAIACLLLMAAGTQAAAGPEKGTATRVIGTRHGACSADIQKFCFDVEHGKGHIRECLAQKTESLSPPCRMRIERYVKHSG